MQYGYPIICTTSQPALLLEVVLELLRLVLNLVGGLVCRIFQFCLKLLQATRLSDQPPVVQEHKHMSRNNWLRCVSLEKNLQVVKGSAWGSVCDVMNFVIHLRPPSRQKLAAI